MARKEDSRITRHVNSQMELTRLGNFDFPRRPQNLFWYLTHKFLFRGLGILTLERWDSLLKKYVNDPRNGIAQTPEGRTSARGNVTSQVFSEDESMSVSTFVKAAVVADVEEIELLVIWKMKDGRRIVGKVRYPLTPDVLLSLSESDEETELIAQVNDFLQSKKEGSPLKSLLRKLLGHKKKKIESGENK